NLGAPMPPLKETPPRATLAFEPITTPAPMPSFPVQETPRSGMNVYGTTDYLLWWMKKGNTPPLATLGDPADTPTGALGQPGTRVLIGGSDGPSIFNGGRIGLGVWLDRQQTWAIEGNYFFLGTRHTSATAANDGTGTKSLAVPFFNADGGFEDAFQL